MKTIPVAYSSRNRLRVLSFLSGSLDPVQPIRVGESAEPSEDGAAPAGTIYGESFGNTCGRS
jgi:hypothetical protein